LKNNPTKNKPRTSLNEKFWWLETIVSGSIEDLLFIQNSEDNPVVNSSHSHY